MAAPDLAIYRTARARWAFARRVLQRAECQNRQDCTDYDLDAATLRVAAMRNIAAAARRAAFATVPTS